MGYMASASACVRNNIAKVPAQLHNPTTTTGMTGIRLGCGLRSTELGQRLQDLLSCARHLFLLSQTVITVYVVMPTQHREKLRTGKERWATVQTWEEHMLRESFQPSLVMIFSGFAIV
jgi:hypothetical protein